MGNLVNHPLDSGGIFQLDSLVDSSQTKSMDASELLSTPAKLALDQRDLESLITHWLPPVRESPQQTFPGVWLPAADYERWLNPQRWPGQHSPDSSSQ